MLALNLLLRILFKVSLKFGLNYHFTAITSYIHYGEIIKSVFEGFNRIISQDINIKKSLPMAGL